MTKNGQEKVMKKLWMTDIHLDHCSLQEGLSFMARVKNENPDVIIISGDIGTSIDNLEYFQEVVKCPILFILGNHDFYYKNIEDVQRKFSSVSGGLNYLSDYPIVIEDSIFLGHDSFADWGYGDILSPAYSKVLVAYSRLNDFHYIKNFSNVYGNIPAVKEIMKYFAQKAADYLDIHLKVALDTNKKVYFVTHAPPFKEACYYDGKESGEDYLPFFACKIVGDKLKEIMTNTSKELTVLCGHTHEEKDINIFPNLSVLVQGAEYSKPNYIILED